MFDFSPFSAVLLDLDGTLYHGTHALPGATALVHRLAGEGRRFACLSNSTEGPAPLVTRLAGIGISVVPEQIYTAAAAAVDYVCDRFGAMGVRPRVFNLATGSVDDLLAGRAECVELPDPLDPASAVNVRCDAVIVGTPTNARATFDRTRAALYLLRNGAALVGICGDRLFPSRRGLEFGSGAWTTMLAYAAGVSPTFTGKPQPLFFRELCDRLHVRPADCLLIGDNLEADIAGGKSVGMRTILTLTGVARRADVESLAPADRPDWVVEDLTALL